MINYIIMFVIGLIVGYGSINILKFWIDSENKMLKFVPIVNGLILSTLPTLLNEIGYFDMAFYSIFLSLLLIISIIDLNIMIIPNKLIVVGLIFGLIYRSICAFSYNNAMIFIYGLIGMLIGFGLYVLIIVLSGGKMGAGDAKLMAFIGLVFGFESVFLVTFFGSVFALIIMIPIMIYKNYNFKMKIPFGPFLAYGLFFMVIGKFIWSNLFIIY